MPSMLIDTSGFFAMHSEKDKNHSPAINRYRKAQTRLTTNYVLAEYVALALIRGLPHPKVLSFSEEVLCDEAVTIIWVDEALHTQAVELLQARPDKKVTRFATLFASS